MKIEIDTEEMLSKKETIELDKASAWMIVLGLTGLKNAMKDQWSHSITKEAKKGLGSGIDQADYMIKTLTDLFDLEDLLK